MTYGIDAYVFLTRPSSFDVLEQLRVEGHVRAVIRTVAGPHQAIIAIEVASIEELPAVHARLGVDIDRADILTVGVPIHTANGGCRIRPRFHVAFALVRIDFAKHAEWYASTGGHSETFAVSTLLGYRDATHLVEITSDDIRDLNAEVTRVLSHEAVTPVASYFSGGAFIAGAGPRP